MSKKKNYIQQGAYRLRRLEAIKEFMIAELANGSCAQSINYKIDAKNCYDQAVACWEVLCENEGGDD